MGLLAISGCASSRPGAGAGRTGDAASAAPPAKSGAVLWAENCGRCHNLRNPAEFDAAEWSVAVHHMRLRVPLTGEEQKQIESFLTSR